MKRIKHLVLPLLMAGAVGLASPEAFANPGIAIPVAVAEQQNKPLLGGKDLDAKPGLGDTDLNNDGKHDYKTLKQEVGQAGEELQDFDDEDMLRPPVFFWLVVGVLSALFLAAIIVVVRRRHRYRFHH